MKLVRLGYSVAETQTVKYLGGQLILPLVAKFLAVDADGELFWYEVEPFLNEEGIEWGTYDECAGIGKVDLEGTDWKETLFEL